MLAKLSNIIRNTYWIETDPKCRGGRSRLYDLRVTYGFANQGDLVNGGLQCTSMALTAVIYWFQKDYTNNFMRRDIDTILLCGNKMHKALRSMGIARVNDGMIGLGDLPHTEWLMVTSIIKTIKDNVGVKLGTESVPVFTSKTGALGGLMSLEDYVASYEPENPHVGFVMTVECYSYAVMRRASEYLLFDSHGNLRYMHKNIVDRGMIVRFPSLHALIGVLQNMFGLRALCDVAPVQCQYFPLAQTMPASTCSTAPQNTKAAEPAKDKKPEASKAKKTSEDTTPPKESPVAEDVMDDYDDDCSPYVSFMGGRAD